jgi:hypothetical protein
VERGFGSQPKSYVQIGLRAFRSERLLRICMLATSCLKTFPQEHCVGSSCDYSGLGEDEPIGTREDLVAVLASDSTSVMPAFSAVSIASVAGAEMATSTGTPIIAVFCTISTETRLVTRTAPVEHAALCGTSAPASLSSAL